MTKRVDVERTARIVVVCGSSGSGKSAWVKQQVARAPRLVVWDPDDEYEAAGCERITSPSELVEALAAAGRRGPGRFAFVATAARHFDFWARCAFAWGQCVAVAEETADVTTPGKAPDGWGQLVRRGRKHGIDIYGVTQRPAESDKTIVGNASCIHAGQLVRVRDRAYIAAEMGVEKRELDALQPLQWVERDMRTGKITRGRMQFPARKGRRTT